MQRRRLPLPHRCGHAGRTAGRRPALAAQAQARPKDVLVVANEFGPNSLDIHTVGANRPYGVSWLCTTG
jgi:uncharacterized phosphosugar-binding protein